MAKKNNAKQSNPTPMHSEHVKALAYQIEQRLLNPPPWQRKILRLIDALVPLPGATELFYECVPAVALSRKQEREADEALSDPTWQRPRKLWKPGQPLSRAERVFFLAWFHRGLCESEKMKPITPPIWRGPGDDGTFEQRMHHMEVLFSTGFAEYFSYMGEPRDLPETEGPVLERYVAELKQELQGGEESQSEAVQWEARVAKELDPKNLHGPAGNIRWLAEALLIVQIYPEWSDAKIAREVGKDRSTLSRSPVYRYAAAMARGKITDLPKGHVVNDPDTGLRDVEAFSESEDDEDSS